MLQLLLGGSGSGKTTLLYQRIRARAEKGEKSILLVPEQFTSSTEGRIYRELGDALSGMVESFSFTSLAEKILSTEGGAAVQTLSDAGRAVLVRRALEELQDNVHYYHRHRRSAAFCQMAAQTIDELKSAGLSGRQLAQLAGACGAESGKLSELALIFQGYETLLARSGMDPSDRLELAGARLEEALESGLIDEKVLNRAVERVLTLKLERGLFEHPYLPEERKPSVFSPKAFPQSLALSRESLVLLKNEGALPLQRRKTVALIGPAADDLYRQLGDYTPPVETNAGCTLLQGLRELAGPEMRLWYNDGSDPKRAAALAAKADTVVLALGGSSSRFEQARFDKNGAALNGSMDCSEGVDSSALRLPDGQHSLFAKVRAAAKTLVTVLIVGRPYAVPEIAKGSDALMVAFYPGPWGGQTLAEALLGRFSPSGRLPASFPQHPGQLPVYYNPKAGTVPWNYADTKEGPLFSFGDVGPNVKDAISAVGLVG